MTSIGSFRYFYWFIVISLIVVSVHCTLNSEQSEIYNKPKLTNDNLASGLTLLLTNDLSVDPSQSPTLVPFVLGTQQPSNDELSTQPSLLVTLSPSFSQFPTIPQSIPPTNTPSIIPSIEVNPVSLHPDVPPTVTPIFDVPLTPTLEPIVTLKPSEVPSAEPIENLPTLIPTLLPSVRPTTYVPTKAPSRVPTLRPTLKPTLSPSVGPSATPTASIAPTVKPSIHPSCSPTVKPTTATPTNLPVRVFTRAPSVRPTVSFAPTTIRPTQPTSMPSIPPPTEEPTRGPTPSMAPSLAPTFVRTAPVISSLFASQITSSGLQVTVLFLEEAHYPGQVFCTGVLSDFAITVEKVLLSEFWAPFVEGDFQLDVTVSGLAALQSYDIYCAVKNAPSYNSTLADMLAAKISIETGCCKTIFFTNAPLMVYGRSSLYLPSQSSLFLYQFALSAAPLLPVVITPVFNAQGSTEPSSVVFTSPLSVAFSASSASLSGGFVLSTNVTGPFRLVLAIGGAGAEEYYSASTDLVVLTDDSPVPPPTLTSCQFSDSGGSLFISFSAPSDKADITAEIWTCSLVFAFIGANQAKCTWTDTFSVRANLSVSNSGVTADSPVSLLADVLRARCITSDTAQCAVRNIFASNQTVYVLPPVNPIIPVVVLLAPTLISKCDAITIDATLSTGSGGRPWLHSVWTVSSMGVSASAIAAISAYLNGLTPLQVAQRSVIVQNALLVPTAYTITLTLTNFLGAHSSTTRLVTVSTNPNVPYVTLLGGSSVSLTANAPLEVYASARPSSCANTQIISFDWTMLQDNVQLNSVQSSSFDPKVYMLKGYTLSVGASYTLLLTATVPATGAVAVVVTSEQVTVDVISGVVTASIRGGSARYFHVDSLLNLDASASTDQNLPTTSTSYLQLNYQWSCVVSSVLNFGQVCDFAFGGQSRNHSSVAINGTLLDSRLVYSFGVMTSASDGRSGSSQVSVRVSADPFGVVVPTVQISSAVVKFNIDSALNLFGYVQAPYDVSARWAVYLAGVEVDFLASSVLSVNFTAVDVASPILFPLTVAPNAFTVGNVLSFRLQALPVGGTALAYSELTATANGPPASGTFFADPEVGSALMTKFGLFTYGWVDDPADYPLSFLFEYILTDDSPALSVQARGRASQATTTLAAGPSYLMYAVTVKCTVYDNYLAGASLSTSVTVNPSAVDVGAFVSTNFNSAFLSSDNGLATQTLNNAAVTINVVNCTATPVTYCAGLHRAACYDAPNTCGSCLDGFVGTVGGANTKCFSEVAPGGALDAPCTINSDCLYGLCSSVTLTCAEPRMTCPSQVVGTVCSGHGTCIFVDPSGNDKKSSCGIFDVRCRAVCSCKVGFGGIDCSMTAKTANTTDATRTALCDGVLRVAATSNPSPQLLSSMVNSLYASYSPVEVYSTRGNLVCQSALSAVAKLAAEGHLTGTTTDVTQNLLAAASDFATATAVPGNVTTVYAESMAQILRGVYQNVMPGQAPLSVVSDNIRVTIFSALASSFANTSMSPPLTDAETAYGALRPSISFAGDSAMHCDSGNGYAQMSLLVWGSNPNHNSSALSSPLLSFQSWEESNSEAARRRLEDTGIASRGSRTLVYENSTEPMYYVTLQFSERQNFNFTVDPRDPPRKGDNTTFPECRTYDGSAYVPCNGCNISSYTNYNVTYGCYDMSVMCNGGNSAGRRLLGSNLDRKLFTPSGDDDGTSLDTGHTTSAQYSAIVKAVVKELAATLSFNPFAIDAEKAKPILAFMGCLVFIVFFGFAYFIAWDRHDHNYVIYTGHGSVAKAMELNKTKLDRAHLNDTHYIELKKRYDEKRKRKELRHTLAYKLETKSFILRQKNEITGEYIDTYHSSGKDESELHSRLLAIDKEEHDENAAPDEQDEEYLQIAKLVSYDSIMEIPSVSSDFGPAHDKFISNTVTAFLEFIIPTNHALLRGNQNRQLLEHLVSKHDYTSMFGEPSMAVNRTSRWLNLTLQLLLGLFIDTLFFGLFYPDAGQCETYVDQQSCMAPINKASNAPLCNWQPDHSGVSVGSCELQRPPNDITFTLTIAMMTIIIAVPLSFLLDFVRLVVCAKRPDFEKMGLVTTFLQSSTRNTTTSSAKNSTLADLYVGIEKKRKDDTDYKLHLMSTSDVDYEDRARHLEDLAARGVYDSVTSASEEVDQILLEVRAFLARYMREGSIPWRNTAGSELVHARANAIQKFIGVYPDGEPAPLPLKHLLRFGTHREKLKAGLERSRTKAYKIVQALEEMGDLEENNKDIALLQRFILEQFDPVKRYALQYQFFSFPVSTPTKIDALVWIAGWIFLLGTCIFFLYWILAWSIQTGGKTFSSWGINYTLTFVQDFCIIQLFKVYVLYILAMYSIRPQLNYVYATLNRVAVRYAQDGGLVDTQDIRVVQHLSPACRAARLTLCKNLAAAKVLQQLDDNDLELCRKQESLPLSFAALFLMVIPALMSLFLNEQLGEMVIQCFLPTFLMAFLLGNYYIFQTSLALFIVVYCFVCGYYMWRFYMLKRAERAAKFALIRKSVSVAQPMDMASDKDGALIDKLNVELSMGKSWKQSKRTERSTSVLKFIAHLRDLVLDWVSDGIQMVVTWLLYTSRELRQSHVNPHDAAWCNMNFPFGLQGSSEHPIVDADSPSAHAPLQRIPHYVQEILISEWTLKDLNATRNKDYLSHMLQRYLFNMHHEDVAYVATGTGHLTRTTSQSGKKLSSVRGKSGRLASFNRNTNVNHSKLDLQELNSTNGRMPLTNRDNSLRHVDEDEMRSFVDGNMHDRFTSPNKRSPRPSVVKPNALAAAMGAYCSPAGLDYRDKFMITFDEYDALRRMMVKHIGDRRAPQESKPGGLTRQQSNRGNMSRQASSKGGRGGGLIRQKSDYQAAVAAYEDFDERVLLVVLVRIARDIYNIYHPGGVALSADEREGVEVSFEEWLAQYKGVIDDKAPFFSFQQWFLRTDREITRYRIKSEDGYILRSLMIDVREDEKVQRRKDEILRFANNRLKSMQSASWMSDQKTESPNGSSKQRNVSSHNLADDERQLMPLSIINPPRYAETRYSGTSPVSDHQFTHSNSNRLGPGLMSPHLVSSPQMFSPSGWNNPNNSQHDIEPVSNWPNSLNTPTPETCTNSFLQAQQKLLVQAQLRVTQQRRVDLDARIKAQNKLEKIESREVVNPQFSSRHSAASNDAEEGNMLWRQSNRSDPDLLSLSSSSGDDSSNDRERLAVINTRVRRNEVARTPSPSVDRSASLFQTSMQVRQEELIQAQIRAVQLRRAELDRLIEIQTAREDTSSVSSLDLISSSTATSGACRSSLVETPETFSRHDSDVTAAAVGNNTPPRHHNETPLSLGSVRDPRMFTAPRQLTAPNSRTTSRTNSRASSPAHGPIIASIRPTSFRLDGESHQEELIQMQLRAVQQRRAELDRLISSQDQSSRLSGSFNGSEANVSHLSTDHSRNSGVEFIANGSTKKSSSSMLGADEGGASPGSVAHSPPRNGEVVQSNWAARCDIKYKVSTPTLVESARNSRPSSIRSESVSETRPVSVRLDSDLEQSLQTQQEDLIQLQLRAVQQRRAELDRLISTQSATNGLTSGNDAVAESPLREKRSPLTRTSSINSEQSVESNKHLPRSQSFLQMEQELLIQAQLKAVQQRRGELERQITIQADRENKGRALLGQQRDTQMRLSQNQQRQREEMVERGL